MKYKFTFFVVLFFIVILYSCAGNKDKDLKTVNIALELSSTYMKYNEKEEALRVVNEALSLVEDNKLINNKILILNSLERYSEAFQECVNQYSKNTYDKTYIYRAIEIAEKQKRYDIQAKLYMTLVDSKTASINDCVFLLKYALNLNLIEDDEINIETIIDEGKIDMNIVDKVIKYCNDINIYNKKYFELVYLATKNNDYRIAAIYSK